jgi:hypothetical protein
MKHGRDGDMVNVRVHAGVELDTGETVTEEFPDFLTLPAYEVID